MQYTDKKTIYPKSKKWTVTLFQTVKLHVQWVDFLAVLTLSWFKINRNHQNKLNWHKIDHNSLWPSLKGRNGEESQHAIEDVVKVEVWVGPFPLTDLHFMKCSFLVLYIPASEPQSGRERQVLQSKLPQKGFLWGLPNQSNLRLFKAFLIPDRIQF